MAARGVHYGNAAYSFKDETVDIKRPQAVRNEPTKPGRWR